MTDLEQMEEDAELHDRVCELEEEVKVLKEQMAEVLVRLTKTEFLAIV